jgi:hypothetical protein
VAIKNWLKGWKVLDQLSRSASRRRYGSKARIQSRPGIELLEDRTLLTVNITNSVPWVSEGPGPINPGEEPATLSTSGRITAIAIDPRQPFLPQQGTGTAYAAAASGGIWKTTNGGLSWAPKTDDQPTLDMGAVAIAPSNPDVVYAGTGEANYSGTMYGIGVLRSADGGDHWALLGGNIFQGDSIASVVVDPRNEDTVYVAIDNGPRVGLWKYTDAGGWVNANVTLPGNGAKPTKANFDFTALLMDPTDPDVLWAAAGWAGGMQNNGVYRSVNGGTSWDYAGDFPSNAHVGRISLAIAPSSPGTLYAAVADPTNGQNVYQIFKTTNGTTTDPSLITWQSLPGVLRDTAPDQLFHEQGAYGNVIVVDPFDANTVYAGGYKIWESTDGGESWTKVSNEDPNNKVHDDDHALVFALNGDTANDTSNHRLLAGTDGGLYYLTTPVTQHNSAIWTSLNSDLQITQFYQVAFDPSPGGGIFGGAQDNGDPAESGPGSTNWTLLPNSRSSDGGDVAVSTSAHGGQSSRYYFVDGDPMRDGTELQLKFQANDPNRFSGLLVLLCPSL